MKLPWVLLLCCVSWSQAQEDAVVTLTKTNFDSHIKDNKHTLVEFYAPWCGHCKKLAPEYGKAAAQLASKGIILAKVDATEQTELASKYNVKGFPTMVWFEDAQNYDYDGGRTSDTIVEWVISMIGAAVTQTSAPPAPSGDKPRVVLHSDSLLRGFEDAAKASRRKASWYWVKAIGRPRVELTHKGEDAVVLEGDVGNKDKILELLSDNTMPLFGPLDGDTFDKYMETSKGLVWSMFPPSEGGFDDIMRKYTPMMSEVAKRFKKKYYVTCTDVDKFKEPVENMLAVTEFPAIAVQKKAGDKKKYVYTGELTAQKIGNFIQDVEDGKVNPKLRTEAVPPKTSDPVKQIVSTNFMAEVFTPDKDVLLEVYAPWCGHCKKLAPEYDKLAKKIEREELFDLLKVLKIDGTANDSPTDNVEWTGFPTIYFVKAGQHEPSVYEGERTAKGLWKYIKKHATKADEIRERIERRKAERRKAEEL